MCAATGVDHPHERHATDTSASTSAPIRSVEPYLHAPILLLAHPALLLDSRPVGTVALQLDPGGVDPLGDEVVARGLRPLEAQRLVEGGVTGEVGRAAELALERHIALHLGGDAVQLRLVVRL